jgi:hypothetical protein
MKHVKNLFFVLLLLFLPQLKASRAKIHHKQKIQQSNKYQYDLAICAIFQNEGRFLKEWIEFHKLIGVQHFFLYNNNSTDNYMEILKPYVNTHEVDLIPWDYSMEGIKLTAQHMAYNDCLSYARGTVKWLAFLDLDEYLFPVQKDNLRDFLKDYEHFGAVCANWVMFGTSNVNEIPKNTLLIESLTMCNLSAGANIHVKSIVCPEKIKHMSIHFADSFDNNSFQVTADKIQFSGPFSPLVALNKLRINHYWTRDKKWLFEVKIERRKRYDSTITTESILQATQELNKEHDTVILKYKDTLQKKVFAR